MDSVVSRWFGAEFRRLHPLLQALHLHGGVLAGPIEIALGRGLARPFGRAIARKLGIPLQPGPHTLRVEIGHRPDCLLWNRRFDERQDMDSTFHPVGAWPDGLWLERTGPVRLGLGVEVVQGGWYWRCRKAWVFGVRLPLALFPQSTAYKRIEEGRYRFQVTFTMPLLGEVLSYGGLLESRSARAVESSQPFAGKI